MRLGRTPRERPDDPAENKADAIESAGEKKADAIEDAGEKKADTIEKVEK